MQEPRERLARCIAISAVLLAVSVVSITPLIGATAMQSDHPYAGDGISEGQMKVTMSDYSSGATEVDILFSMKGGDAFRDHVHPWGFEYLDTFAWTAPHGPSLAPCSVSDVSAAGIDRDDDNEGTTTDVDILPYLSGAWLQANSFGGTMYNGDEFSAPDEEYNGGPGSGTGAGKTDGDPNLEYYPDDRIFTSISSCVENPDEEGWYQWTVKINGTNWDGYEEGAQLTQADSHQGEFIAVELNTNWIPVCDGCENRSDAREALGPPPSEESSDSTAATATPEPAATATPTPTPEPAATATATPGSMSEATSTPTPDGSNDGPSEATASPTSESGNTTPTAGNGAGFGALSILLPIVVFVNYRLLR